MGARGPFSSVAGFRTLLGEKASALERSAVRDEGVGARSPVREILCSAKNPMGVIMLFHAFAESATAGPGVNPVRPRAGERRGKSRSGRPDGTPAETSTGAVRFGSGRPGRGVSTGGALRPRGDHAE